MNCLTQPSRIGVPSCRKSRSEVQCAGWRVPPTGFHVGLAMCVVFGFICVSRITAAEPAIVSVEKWTNVFAGEAITQRLRLNGGAAPGQAVGWRVSLETAVIAHRESAIQADAEFGPLLSVQFQLPEGDSKTILPVSIFVTQDGQEVLATQLWIYPRDPFQQPIRNGWDCF